MIHVNLDEINVKIFSENGEIIETWFDLPTEDKVSYQIELKYIYLF